MIVLCLAGCGGKQKNVEGNLEDLMEKLYANVGESVQLPFVSNITLSDDMDVPVSGIEYFIGVKGIPYTEGIASESLIGAVAHSVVLLRMSDNADIENAKKQIRENVDPMKWICAGVTREEVIVENIGNLVVLILSHDGPALRDAFFKLAE